MHDESLHRALHIEHFEAQAVTGDQAGVGVLAARLRVERGLVENDLNDVPGECPVDELAVGDDAAHLGVRGQVGEAEERHLAVRTQRPVRLCRDGGALLGLRVGLRPVLLLLHELAEPGLVHLEALLGRHLEGEVEREAVGVVQGERPVRSDVGAVLRARLPRSEVEDLRAGREGAPERLLLGIGNRRDPRPLADHVAVGRGHQVLAHRQQLGQHRIVHAQQPHGADAAPQQPAQHIATSLVAGGDAVGHQHQRGAHVVTDDAQPDVGLRVGAVAGARDLRRTADHREDLVDLVHVGDALAAGTRCAPAPCRCRCSWPATVRTRRSRPSHGRRRAPRSGTRGSRSPGNGPRRRSGHRLRRARGHGRCRSRCMGRPDRECPCASSCP